MALSRQDFPILDAEKYKVFEGVAHGAYILEKGGEAPDILLVATGAEVWLALKTAERLAGEGFSVRVVSMPSWRIFEEQSEEYKASIFPDHLPKLAIEAGATLGLVEVRWAAWTCDRTRPVWCVCSGPVALERLGFNVENVAGEGAQTDRSAKTK